ncbi:MAG: hypothetical protein NZ958_06035 [Bacteroidia bacterium]|nr:hypothetical protein [Bacteroidia bacterium]MDW8088823.1 hypothetical protein [Bacteroidia bacterium]
MAYSPDEYKALKEFHKQSLREQRALAEQLRWAKLRQRTQWHLAQLARSLEALGVSPPEEKGQALTPPPPPQADKTLF